MTRLFLNEAARESLLKTGRATWRKRVEQAQSHGAIASAVYPAAELGWIAWFGPPWKNERQGNELTRKIYKRGFECPTPPGALYWIPEQWQCCTGCNAGNGVIYRMGLRWVPAHPWRSAATMHSKYARLHVRVVSVKVVKDGEWWWRIELERITK